MSDFSSWGGGADSRDVAPKAEVVSHPRSNSHSWLAIVTLVIVSWLALAGGLVIFLQAQEIDELRSWLTRTGERIQAVDDRVDALDSQHDEHVQDGIDISGVYEEALPSVVTVFCGSGQGTGFAYDVIPTDGYKTTIITNHHVIEDCTYDGTRTIKLTNSDGDAFRGYVYNWDEKNDLATVDVKRHLTPLVDAEEPAIGDPVIAVGSPKGLSNSVTQGIVSNLYRDAVQTDAAINHGNSGGPLLDRFGRVLGVTTLGLDREGLNIAVHIRQFCEEILNCR